MKDVVLIELANRWMADAIPSENAVAPNIDDEDARMLRDIRQGQREAKRECADTLITLVQMLGEKE